ncbi:hypothetical protein LUW76_32985 [Actinomadura madurae]|uniref:hypothetical protein n=1 Tax=Actinomadura madurae TaxID=1993 RepID=UPI002025C85A|nr:hypothetical protein [Actinomadura madurae]URN01915.1 hypothetical protein LUW76_32985 [Actinomadura madurae]
MPGWGRERGRCRTTRSTRPGAPPTRPAPCSRARAPRRSRPRRRRERSPPVPDGPPEQCFAEIARLGYQQKVVYHSAGRFWPLQWAETGLFAVLTAGLTGLCFYWTRRRLF